MKIVCDACQAKYSISDDKVQGKVFKIRCKKCSNIIVVRGGAGAAEAGAAPAAGERHARLRLRLRGRRSGAGRRRGRLARRDQPGSGRSDDGRRGAAALRRAARSTPRRTSGARASPTGCRSRRSTRSPAFVASGADGCGPGRRRRRRGGGRVDVRAAAVGDEAGTVRSDPGDLFAAASASPRARDEDDGGDLFGSKPAPRGRGAPDAGRGGRAKLRGERNENSVLFSLNNLAQLASDKPAPAASPSPRPRRDRRGTRPARPAARAPV